MRLLVFTFWIVLARRAGITCSPAGVHISNMMKKRLILGKGYPVQRDPSLGTVSTSPGALPPESPRAAA